jgi:hypothetical protein
MIALHLRFVKQDRQKSTGTSRRRFYKKSQTLLETCKKMIILTTPQQRTSASSALRRFSLIILRILPKLTPARFGLFHSNCKSRSTAVFFTRFARRYPYRIAWEPALGSSAFNKPGREAGAGGSEPALGGCARLAGAGWTDGDREPVTAGDRRRRPKPLPLRPGPGGRRAPNATARHTHLTPHRRRMRAQEPTPGGSPRPLPGRAAHSPKISSSRSRR